MPSIRLRSRQSRRRLAPLSLAAALLWAAPALAGDKPATPEGADALRALIAKYLPAAQAGATPLVTVKPDGAHYLVSADLSALNALLAETGITYDPAVITYQAVEQDDGNWRVAMDSLPKIGFHSKDATGAIELTNFRSSALISPAIAWLLSGSANMDKGTFQIQNPKITQTIDFGPVQETIATNVAGDGSVSTQVKEEIAELGVKAVGGGAGENESPINFSGRAEKALISLGVDGFKSRKAFDLWGLLAAHPARTDLASHEAELKGLLKALAAPGLKLDEGIEAQKAVVTSSLGAIALGDFKYQLGAANAGPQSAITLSLSADGLSLPVGLLPPNAGALTPSKIDIAAKLKGIDISAAANEWISDLSLQGDGPLLSDDNAEKVEAAFISAGPVQIEFAPSHVVAPAVDADFSGLIRLDHNKPTAAITIHARSFDKTMAAVKDLGPDISAKAMPGLALAKGLAKSESDGSLSWLVELDAQRSIKVNGIPFGKAP
ncbi:MAG TPA: hypothetical protein VIJ63_02830, partial [Roseiarcus sp.]